MDRPQDSSIGQEVQKVKKKLKKSIGLVEVQKVERVPVRQSLNLAVHDVQVNSTSLSGSQPNQESP